MKEQELDKLIRDSRQEPAENPLFTRKVMNRLPAPKDSHRTRAILATGFASLVAVTACLAYLTATGGIETLLSPGSIARNEYIAQVVAYLVLMAVTAITAWQTVRCVMEGE